jgi:large subunit ribosomal protein L35
MPKLKTRKATAKRFRFTASGKIKHGRSNRGHLMSHRKSKRKRNLRGTGYLSAADQGRIERLLPGR